MEFGRNHSAQPYIVCVFFFLCMSVDLNAVRTKHREYHMCVVAVFLPRVSVALYFDVHRAQDDSGSWPDNAPIIFFTIALTPNWARFGSFSLQQVIGTSFDHKLHTRRIQTDQFSRSGDVLNLRLTTCLVILFWTLPYLAFL